MTEPSAPASGGALQGIHVLDLSRVLSGPYCTQVLADHGADVLKIEPPGGDETRQWGPPFVDGVAAYYRGINRNKRGCTLDLSQDAGRERLLAMLTEADVLIENFKAGTMERWGIGYEALAIRFPRLVYCAISGFGDTGPLGGLPGYDAAVQAIGGIMSVNGEPDGLATRVGVPVVDMVTGLNAAIGILLALQERARSGRGQRVDTSLFDCALSLLHPHVANYFASGVVPRRTGNAHPNITPYDTVQTSTVPIFIAVGNDRQFVRLCECIDAADLAHDPRFASNAQRTAHRNELMTLLARHMRGRDGHALADSLMQAGVPCAAVLDVAQAVGHPHAQHTGRIVEMPGYRGIASPITLNRTPATYRSVPPPLQAE